MTEPQRRPLLVVLSGPSGVGKDAVVGAMRASHPDIYFAVTATTRTQRPGEVNEVDYIFMTKPRFQFLRDQGEFLENAEVYGNFYGVPKFTVRDAMAAGRDVLVKVDVQGAATIRKMAPGALLLFLAAPDMDELERRLRTRKTESEEQMAIRIATARHEMEQASWFDMVIVNETDAVERTVDHILEAMREARNADPARVVEL